MQWKGTEQIGMKDKEIGVKKKLSGDIIELLIYHQPGVKPSLTLHPFGVLGYVAGHSLTETGIRHR